VRAPHGEESDDGGNEIYIEMRKMQKHFERHDVMLRVIRRW